ncbi:hypothetical protein ACJ72_00606 [Emergomyces africanus]|uniref:Malate/L-lactate dehydrogenase n=1 Tax=Emergomyces africanus TaxID=1955775 RepID=A0A1B7P7L1_9EURO|nr:hypothetical protein ACJ72_00606 [Emergomyces africanus]
MTSPQRDSQTASVAPSVADTFVRALLEKHGVSPQNATIVAKCLVEADLRGVDSHGINRIPSYLTRIRQGVLNPSATPLVKQITPVVAQVDGQNGFGFVAAHVAMDRAIAMAKDYGIGMVSITHSNHFGMSASFVQQALDADMMSLVFTNSSPALPAWGGREKLLGVFAYRMWSTCWREIRQAKFIKRRGEGSKFPRLGIRREWRATTDPDAALKGVMLPMGGPKGSGLAIMMDVFSGVLSGSAFAGHVTGPYDPSKQADVGHFMMAIKPDLFMELDEFKTRMDYLYQRVVGGERMEGVDRIYYPGEIELLTAQKRRAEGIPYAQVEIEALNREADEVGVAHLDGQLCT